MPTSEVRTFSAHIPIRAIFFAFFFIGCTAFGGPAAHIGYFRESFVSRRQWLTDETFADLFALSQFLPGPGSTQLAVAIGTVCRGKLGGLAALVGFTLPASVLVIAFGLGLLASDAAVDSNWLHGLKIAVVAVVLRAVSQMAPRLCPDWRGRIIAAIVLGGLILIPISSGQIIAIAVAGITGLVWRRQFSSSEVSQTSVMDSLTFGTGILLLLAVLLIGLPVLTLVTGVPTLIDVMDGLFRSGALVFGGGHVVLPLLEAEFVPTGWVDRDVFFAGYGIMQALPGPIFAFAGYLGTVMSPVPNGLLGGGICLAALFLPGLLLIWGVLPFWPRFSANHTLRSMLRDVNAAVVGLLAAALYDPIWVGAISNWTDAGLALAAFLAIQSQGIPTWVVVIGCALCGAALS